MAPPATPEAPPETLGAMMDAVLTRGRRAYSGRIDEVVSQRNKKDEPPVRPTSDAEPVRRFGRYALVKKLATGGMAEIWLARQRGLAGFNRFVVIKKILAHLSEQETFVKMFLDEARTSAQLNHPNVVQIYDLGREGDSYYIAMEFIAGENLAAIAWRGVKRGQPLSPYFAARIVADACKALHYAHHLRGSDGQSLEIVHRDISPQNVLVTYEGEVKVVDFGIAKAATKSEHTKTGMLKGKFSYMSPEQCLGAQVDMRSDIFALGILLYELCTGKRLFKHESELMILEMITRRTVVPPSEVSPEIGPRLEEIILRALKKNANARFQTAQDMQIELEEYLREEAVQATSAELAEYMRGLFADKIEEKRRLREVASQDAASTRLGEEDTALETPARTQNTPGRVSRRRVVRGLPPNELRAQAAQDRVGQDRIGLHSDTQTMARPSGSLEPTPAPRVGIAPGEMPFREGVMDTPSDGSLEDQRSRALLGGVGGVLAAIGVPRFQRLVTLGAMLIIFLASAFLYYALQSTHELDPSGDGSDDTEIQAEHIPPPPPVRTGSIRIDSEPRGALIFLNDKPMTLDQPGDQARTPSDVFSLAYGESYRLKLVMPGHVDHVETLEMNETADGKEIAARLAPLPGTLEVDVVGDGAQGVRVRIDGKEVGPGPRITQKRPAGEVEITAEPERSGVTCKATPGPSLQLLPGGTTRTTIRCEGPPESTKAPSPTTESESPLSHPPRANAARNSSSKSVNARKLAESSRVGSGDCRAENGLSPGYATIHTTPYADIYFNGQKLGETPLSKQKFPAGCVVIEIVHVEDGRRVTKKLAIEPNMVSIFRFTL